MYMLINKRTNKSVILPNIHGCINISNDRYVGVFSPPSSCPQSIGVPAPGGR